MFWLGIIAFGFFFLGDANDRFWGKRSLRFCFWAGCILLVASILYQVITGTSMFGLGGTIVAAVLAVVFFLLMLQALFGSFSNEEGYGNPGEKRRVYTQKLYAICRHPGVLMFYGLVICLYFTGLSPAAAITYAVLNTLLAWFEDAVVFPHMLAGYDEYKKTTRFMLPTPASIRRCIHDYRGRA